MVKTHVVIVTVAVLVLAGHSRADEQNPAPVQPPAPPAPAAAPDPVTKQIETLKHEIESLKKNLENNGGHNAQDPNGGNNGGGRGRRWGGPPPDNGNGGQPQGGPGAGARGFGRQFMGPMMNQLAGVDLESPKAAGREDKLPLGGEKHFVLNVPVGGVDQIGVQNNGPQGGSWKVEELFKLTDDQTKAVEALRTEYAAEKKKLEDEILAQQMALADKAKKLRETYEQRANDVLTGADKEAKQKIDAVEKDTATKIETVVADATANTDNNDPQQAINTVTTVREKLTPIVQDARKQMVDLIPADTRAKVQDVFTKDEAAQKQRQDFFQRMRNRGAPGGDTQKPPEKEKEKTDF